MRRTLSEFASYLRAAGAPVSSSEVVDCMKALPLIDIFDRKQFRATLRSHLIKSKNNFGKFDDCFQLYFEGVRPESDNFESDRDDQNAMADFFRGQIEESDDRLFTQIMELLGNGEEGFIETVQSIRRGEGAESSGGDSNRGSSGLQALAGKLEALRALELAQKELERFFRENAPIPNPEQTDTRQNGLLRRVRILRSMVMDTEPSEKGRVIRGNRHSERDVDKSLMALAPEDRNQLLRLVRILVRKVDSVNSLRQKVKRKGKLNIKKTIRGSIKFGGDPVKLYYFEKKRRKGNIVVLCDVSGSVYSMANVMLTILHAISAHFSRIHSFAFTNSPIEITELFQRENLETALASAMDRQLIPRNATDYGNAFREFERDYMSVLNSRTTVIIFGDARNNGNLCEEGILERISRKSKKVVWLNPENANSWNQGDSEAAAYMPYCTEFRECRTFNQLAEFIEKFSAR